MEELFKIKDMNREWKTLKEYDDILLNFITVSPVSPSTARRCATLYAAHGVGDERRALYLPRAARCPRGRVDRSGRQGLCSGGDMHVKGHGGYVGDDGVPRLNVLEVQKQIRSLPKPVIAAVNGFAIGGGHVLHVVCDLTIASDNAVFGQTGPRVGSFDAGFGSSYLARVVGQKKAREIWFLCRKYNAQEALDMGLVNKVVPLAELENEYVAWAEEMMQLSPLALRMIKVGLNAELDGQAGIQELAGDATMLYYMTDEAQEGGRAFFGKA